MTKFRKILVAVLMLAMAITLMPVTAEAVVYRGWKPVYIGQPTKILKLKKAKWKSSALMYLRSMKTAYN